MTSGATNVCSEDLGQTLQSLHKSADHYSTVGMTNTLCVSAQQKVYLVNMTKSAAHHRTTDTADTNLFSHVYIHNLHKYVFLDYDINRRTRTNLKDYYFYFCLWRFSV